MRQLIAWQVPDHLYAGQVRDARLVFLWFIGRVAVMIVVFGGITIQVIQHFYPGLPSRIYHVMWWVVLCNVGIFVVGYIVQEVFWAVGRHWPQCRSWNFVATRGVKVSDSFRAWSRFTAFNVEAYPDSMCDRVLVLYDKAGMHYRRTLPGDRLDDLIIRFVAKHLPLLEEVDDPDAVVLKWNDPPVWLLWLIGLLNVAYAVLLGYLIKGWISGDVLKLIWYSLFFINPATAASLLGWWTGWLKRRRIKAYGWWVAFSMMALFAFFIGFALLP